MVTSTAANATPTLMLTNASTTTTATPTAGTTPTTAITVAGHQNYIWDGTLPTAVGKVEKEFEKITITNQKKLFGIGAIEIGGSSPVDNKFLALAGEGDDKIGDPACLVFLTTIVSEVELACPTDADLQRKLQSHPANLHYFMSHDIDTSDKEEVMQIALLPMFLLYD
eukprot:3116186-Ditylum_brightwellii.AAC.2